MKSIYTISLLLLSNTFMTLAWYGHLKFSEWKGFQKLGLVSIVFISWGIALFEYCLMVPANRIGYTKYGGPFSLVQLKVIQEVITLVVFSIFTLILFKSETMKWNHLLAFGLLVCAVWLVFKK
ncbi:MAG: DMT family protein [Saprospiraceae bacterium]|nr:DMT family protein [Saprospiraceae bacterium]